MSEGDAASRIVSGIPETDDTTPCLFEIHHGSTVLRVADDWSGHVLIERIYNGLREARRSRDVGHTVPTAPTPGSEAENLTVEAALFHGFRPIDGTADYRASAQQIVALVHAAREQGRMDVLQTREPND